MMKSDSYRDFVIRLGKWTCLVESHPHLAHIAIVHAWELRETTVIDLLDGRYGGHPLVKPWTYPIRSRSDRLAVANQIQDAVDTALADEPPNWIKMELLLLKTYALLHTHLGAIVLNETQNFLKSNADLECYSPYILHLDARINYEEGNLEQALPLCEKSLEIAQAQDNKYQALWCLRWQGMVTMNDNPKIAANYLEHAHTIAKELGTPYHTEAILTEMGWASSILGEYDLALAFYNQGRQISSSLDETSDRHALTLSLSHSDLQDGQQAFEWAQWAQEWHVSHGSVGDSWTLLGLAQALILLKRFDEAQDNLDTARELAFKSGQEREIGTYYYVSGLYETARGGPTTGLETLKQALEIFERTNTQMYTNRCLLALARAEIEIYRLAGGDDTSDAAGHWMAFLEDHARTRNLPGILMEHSLLKAELQILQKRHADARNTLVDALEIENSPGVRTLHNRILEQIKNLDTIPPHTENSEATHKYRK